MKSVWSTVCTQLQQSTEYILVIPSDTIAYRRFRREFSFRYLPNLWLSSPKKRLHQPQEPTIPLPRPSMMARAPSGAFHDTTAAIEVRMAMTQTHGFRAGDGGE